MARVATEWQVGCSGSRREPNGGGIIHFRSASGGLTSHGMCIMETAFKAQLSGERGEGSAACAPLTMQPVSPGMPAWALRAVMSL